MSKKEAEKKEIKLPKNFKQILVEVIDPRQSTDYFDLGEITFPIQVMPLFLEKKFIRLARKYEGPEKYDRMLQLTVGELCHFYYPSLTINWPVTVANCDDFEAFYVGHLEKIQYNDEVYNVVCQVINQIDWKPTDPKQDAEWLRYIPARVFSTANTYMSLGESLTVEQVFSTMTRGLIEIRKLINMIQNDRMIMTDEIKPVIGTKPKQPQAANLDDYLKGLADQGFSLTDMF